MKVANTTKNVLSKIFNISLFSKHTSLVLSLGLGFIASSSSFLEARELPNDVVSHFWQEGKTQVASVTFNGTELIRFKSTPSADSEDDDDDDDADDIAEEAEELAVHIQELITDKKFDPNLLLPSKDEDKSVIKHDSLAITFNPLVGGKTKEVSKESNKKNSTLAYDTALKIVNTIRTAYNVGIIPTDLGDYTDKFGQNKLEMLGQTFTGHASWYGGQFNGRRCSDGTRFDQDALSAAHRSLPFGTKLLVKNCKTGNTCIVEVKDRGPFIDGRIIDLSKGAAKQLNMLSSGIAYVHCTVLGAN